METNKPLTVEEAANDLADHKYPQSTLRPIGYKSFKAGAEWQKEQDKDALTLANQLAAAAHLKADKIHQLLSGYTNEEIFHKLQQVLYDDPNL